MKKREYLRAVRKAKRIFGYIQVVEGRRVASRISKRLARDLVRQIDEEATITASWADEDQEQFLLVGGY